MTPAAPRILLMTGDGKGKTTAALGLVLRAVGHGQRAVVVRFLKNSQAVGELAGLERLGVPVLGGGLGFVNRPGSQPFAEHVAAATAALAAAAELLAGGEFDVVVLDEVCTAVSLGLLTDEAVVAAISATRPEGVVALTGRGATPRLVELADTVTDMVCVKHAYQQGVKSQRGVER
jgi:cob(I)alamin adenosyltransferase